MICDGSSKRLSPPTIRRRRHEWLTLDITLPSAPVWVSVDGSRFHQILSNLLTNAIRHANAASRVWVRIEVVDDMARLVVIDEGRGIEANVLAHIFEPFAQAAAGANGGLGLGLSVVRKPSNCTADRSLPQAMDRDTVPRSSSHCRSVRRP